MAQKMIIIRGYPGSGKTTTGRYLERRGLGTFIDHNAILNYLAGMVGGNDDGIYDEIHSLEKAMAHKLINDGKNAIVARGFGSLDSIAPYLQVADKAGVEAYIFRLDVSESNLKQRVTSEERQGDLNTTLDAAALLRWMASHPMQPIDGERIIDANQPIESVLEQIKTTLS